MVVEWRKVLVDGDIKRAIGVSGDAGDGSTISSGVKFYVDIPYDCTITAWSLTSGTGESGNISFDIWKAAGSVPTGSDSIVNGDYLTLIGQIYNYSNSLGTWSTLSVSAGDVICFNIRGNSTLQKITLNLWVNK